MFCLYCLRLAQPFPLKCYLSCSCLPKTAHHPTFFKFIGISTGNKCMESFVFSFSTTHKILSINKSCTVIRIRNEEKRSLCAGAIACLYAKFVCWHETINTHQERRKRFVTKQKHVYFKRDKTRKQKYVQWNMPSRAMQNVKEIQSIESRKIRTNWATKKQKECL